MRNHSDIFCVFFRIRGKLGSLALLIRSTGYTIAFAVGAYVDYAVVPFIYLGIPIVFFVLLICLPDTPAQHIRTAKYDVSFFILIFKDKKN